MKTFDKLGLKKDILAVLAKLKFKEALEVQEKITPLAMKGKNIVFTSRTGSGKTLAYTLGYLGKLNKKLGIQMLIIVPTRELCIQVGKEIQKIAEPLGFFTGMLYGGRDVYGDSKTTNKKIHILVGTPGRLIQHINVKSIKVGDVSYLVYDESDQMFDQGFYDDCKYIKKRVSKDAQIILASATITHKVEYFVEDEIKDFEYLEVGELIPKNIVQEKMYCDKNEKQEIVVNKFLEKNFKSAIVFCNTKSKVTSISQALAYRKFNAKPLSSALEQQDRLNTLNLFKDGKIKVLVTTDVAARGLHIENVDIVINFDVPTKEEFYIHRIGRTGRRDEKGYALTLICPEDVERFKEIESAYKLDIVDKTKQI